MKNFLLLILAISIASYSFGQISDKQAELVYEHLNPFPDKTQLAIAIITNGKPQYFGVKLFGDTVRSVVNYQQVFEIGSITKVFTSTLLANMVEQQKVQLDDPIQQYFDYELKTGRQITFKHLANHTAGLPRLPSNMSMFSVDPKNPYKDYDAEKLEKYLSKKMELAQEPGIKYAYSNLGAGLLSYLLAEISESSFEGLLQNQILEKYAMLNTTTNKTKVEDKLVKGLNPSGVETPNWDFDVMAGGGAMLSSVEDLVKFAQAHFNAENTELALTRKPTFTVNDKLKMALGWHILKSKNGYELTWHNGGTGGYSSSMALDMDGKNAVIILSNVSAYHQQMRNIDKLCFELMETLKE